MTTPDMTTPAVTGEVTLTLADHLRMLRRPLLRISWRFALIIILMVTLIWAFTLPDDDWLRLRDEPWWAFLQWLRGPAWFILFATLFLLAVVVLANVAAFARYPHVNRRLIYEANAQHIVTRDAAGFSLTVPWANVIRTRDSAAMLAMQMPTRAWRYVMWRGFNDEDRKRILAWAERRAL